MHIKKITSQQAKPSRMVAVSMNDRPAILLDGTLITVDARTVEGVFDLPLCKTIIKRVVASYNAHDQLIVALEVSVGFMRCESTDGCAGRCDTCKAALKIYTALALAKGEQQ